MSGALSCSHSSRRGSRVVMPLTLKVAIFMALCRAPERRTIDRDRGRLAARAAAGGARSILRRTGASSGCRCGAFSSDAGSASEGSLRREASACSMSARAASITARIARSALRGERAISASSSARCSGSDSARAGRPRVGDLEAGAQQRAQRLAHLRQHAVVAGAQQALVKAQVVRRCSRRRARPRPSCRHRRPRSRRCRARWRARRRGAPPPARRRGAAPAGRAGSRASGRPCDCQATTSGSNQFHCSAASTRVPSFGPVTSRPLATSDLTASRTTVRLTPNCSHSSGSGGIEAPAA